MANEFEKVLEDIVEAPVKAVEFCDKAVKVLDTVIKDDPEAKTILAQLVTLSEKIGKDGATDLAEKGLNPTDDLATLQDIEALANYVKSTVVPFVETTYGEVVTDVEAAAPAATTATT